MNKLKKFELSYNEAIQNIKHYSENLNQEVSVFTNYMIQTRVSAESFLPIDLKNIFDSAENFSQFLKFFEKNLISHNICFPIINGEPKVLFHSDNTKNLIEIIKKEFQYPKETEFEKIIFLKNTLEFVDEHSLYVVGNNKKIFFHQAAIYGIEQAIADLGEDYYPEWLFEYKQFIF